MCERREFRLKWREAWSVDAGSGFHGLQRSELQFSDRTRHIDWQTSAGQNTMDPLPGELSSLCSPRDRTGLTDKRRTQISAAAAHDRTGRRRLRRC
jgi:hypothetical protein